MRPVAEGIVDPIENAKPERRDNGSGEAEDHQLPNQKPAEQWFAIGIKNNHQRKNRNGNTGEKPEQSLCKSLTPKDQPFVALNNQASDE